MTLCTNHRPLPASSAGNGEYLIKLLRPSEAITNQVFRSSFNPILFYITYKKNKTTLISASAEYRLCRGPVMVFVPYDDDLFEVLEVHTTAN